LRLELFSRDSLSRHRMRPHFIEKKVLTLAAAQRMVIAFSSEIERVRCVWERSFLVRRSSRWA
jgi:hypothetical protein